MPTVLGPCTIGKIMNSLFETVDSTVAGRIEHFGSDTLQIVDGGQIADECRHGTNNSFRLILNSIDSWINQ